MQPRRLLEALLGGYVALLVLPAVALGGPWTVAAAERLAALVAAGGLIALVVAAAARDLPDLPDRLATLRAAVLTVGPPLAYLPVMLLLTPPGSSAALVAMAGLLAVLPGIALPVGGAVLQSRRVRATATEVAVVTVGAADADDGPDRQLLAGLAVVAVAFVAAGAVALSTGDAEAGAIGPAFGGLWTSIALLAHDDASEVAVTDAGLRVDRSVTSWDALAGYRVTDEAVELVRPQWYLPDRTFEREAIGDEAALLAGLDRFLPRLDGR